MLFSKFSLFGSKSTRKSTKANRKRSEQQRRQAGRRLVVESLEDRRLLAATSWTGTTSTDWGVISNWSGGVVPTAADDVTINDVANDPTLDTTRAVGSLAGNGLINLSTFALTIGNGSSTSYSGTLSGTGGITKIGAGTLTLSGTNTYNGATTINAGAVILSGPNGSATSSAFTVSAGGKLSLDNSANNNTNRLGDALALTLAGGEFEFKGSSSTTASETVGALTLPSGASTVTAIPVSGGSSTTLIFASASRTAGATVLFRGTSLGGAPGAGVANINFANATNLSLTGANNSQLNKPIVPYASGDTSVTGTGIGFVTHNVNSASNATTTNGIRLLADAEYQIPAASGTAVTAGVNLKFTASYNASSHIDVAVNSLVLTNGSTYTLTATNVHTLTVTSGSIFSISGSNALAGGTGAGTVAFGTAEGIITAAGTSTLTFSSLSPLTGSAGLTKSGGGTLRTNNNSATSFTGTVTINAGTFQEGVASALNSNNVTIQAGAMFDLNGFSDTIGTLTLASGTSAGAAVTTAAGTLTLGGNVTLNVNGTGATGATISGNLALGATRSVTVADGTATNDLSVSAVVSGTTFGVTKAGNGTLALSSTNNYTGATTVSTGTLLVNGSVTSSATVAAGATLGGTGTVQGSVTVNGTGASHGTLSPGTSPGTLIVNTLTLNDDSAYTVEIGGNTPGNYDQTTVTATGITTLGSNVGLNLSAFGGYVPLAGDQYVIINKTSTGAMSGTFQGLIEGAAITNFLGQAGLTAHITYVGGTGNDVVITVAPLVPEVTVSPTAVNVTEAGTIATYDLFLGTPPTGEVTITITPDAQTTVNPSTLTFTTTNWATHQPVTVTAVDDQVVEGTHSSTIQHAAVGGGYTGVTISDVTATVTDNDKASLSINDISVGEGGVFTFTITSNKVASQDLTVVVNTANGTATLVGL
ncbi:MAG: autotransporter-associated beta strand repeat-containing protein, partial [Planctomycetota bacterium]|nr:autotransporter-associated beta strand repeat-containing protein [Planctomycetota bacterium]